MDTRPEGVVLGLLYVDAHYRGVVMTVYRDIRRR